MVYFTSIGFFYCKNQVSVCTTERQLLLKMQHLGCWCHWFSAGVTKNMQTILIITISQSTDSLNCTERDKDWLKTWRLDIFNTSYCFKISDKSDTCWIWRLFLFSCLLISSALITLTTMTFFAFVFSPFDNNFQMWLLCPLFWTFQMDKSKPDFNIQSI